MFSDATKAFLCLIGVKEFKNIVPGQAGFCELYKLYRFALDSPVQLTLSPDRGAKKQEKEPTETSSGTSPGLLLLSE